MFKSVIAWQSLLSGDKTGHDLHTDRWTQPLLVEDKFPCTRITTLLSQGLVRLASRGDPGLRVAFKCLNV